MLLEEITAPGTPGSNTLTLYGKLDGGFTKLFYKQEDGTEVGPLGAAGGSGANTTLSNLVSPTDINQSLIPDGTFDLGTATDTWDDLFVTRISEIQSITFSPNDHSITDIGSAALVIDTGSGSLRLENSGFTFAEFAPLFTTLTTARDSNLGVFFTLFHDSTSPVNGDFSFLAFSANDSATNTTTYGEIAGIVKNPLNGSEEGELRFSVTTDGSLSEVLSLDSFNNAVRVGFYGAAPVALQTGVAVTASAIHTALVNLGLITS